MWIPGESNLWSEIVEISFVQLLVGSDLRTRQAIVWTKQQVPDNSVSRRNGIVV